MAKKIVYIWDGDYPWDIRVEKICLSLVNAGYEVHIAARNLEQKVDYEEEKENLRNAALPAVV